MTLDLGTFAETVRVTYGVYGTELQKKGLVEPGGCNELLNADNSGGVEEVARSYVDAGADVIMTNTLLVNRFILAPCGAAGTGLTCGTHGEYIARACVQLATEAART